MKKELNLWQFIADRLKMKQKAMLLVVAESSGSSPGRQGFKMAVGEDGALFGSIGGGIMEVKLAELAKKRLSDEQAAPLLKRQIHRKSVPQFQSGMICSGEQTVLFFCLADEHLKAVQTAVRCLKNHRPALLRIACSTDNQGFRVLPDIKNENPFRFEKSGENEFLFEENIGFKNYLYIIGGGHCALALSELMSRMDFHICLLDDRPDLSTISENRFIHQKHILDSYQQVGEFISSGTNVYVVVMTLGYRSDEVALRQLLDKSFKYLGLLGSEAKVAALLEKLRAEHVPTEKLNSIHTPAGLKIKSRTPEEIALSIAAEIILVKNAKI